MCVYKKEKRVRGLIDCNVCLVWPHFLCVTNTSKDQGYTDSLSLSELVETAKMP